MIAWITAHWGWIAGFGGGGIVLAAILLWFFAPAVAVVVEQVVIRWFKWVLQHPTATLCLLLATAAAFGFLDSYGARQRIVVIERDAKTAADKCVADLASKDNTIHGYEAQQAAFADASRQAAHNLANALSQSAAAMAENERLQRQADASNAGWLKVYQQRPQACKAALEAMAVACDSVSKDY